MLVNTYIACEDDILECASLEHLNEVIIEAGPLSRLGKASLRKAQILAAKAKEAGLKTVLLWDILIEESCASDLFSMVDNLDFGLFDAARVYDIGAAGYLIERFPGLNLQLICQGRNHNKAALTAWAEYFSKQQGKALERLILSTQLSQDTLCEYIKDLDTPIEVVGAGAIEMFYSARALLSAFYKKNTAKQINIMSSSKELDGRSFDTIETRHGTFMFHDSDYFILDRVEKLKEAGLYSLHIDLRHISEGDRAAEDISYYHDALFSSEAKEIKWPKEKAALFFDKNDTTKDFLKLKSPLLAKRDENCIAQVIAAESGAYLCFQCFRDASLSAPLTIVNTEGEVREGLEIDFKDSLAKPLTECQADQLIFAKPLSRVSPGALLFYKIDESLPVD